MTDDSSRELAGALKHLIAMRLKHGAKSAIGFRCSNIIELLQTHEITSSPYIQAELVKNIKQQMADLAALNAEER